jgi:hypothetical protein
MKASMIKGIPVTLYIPTKTGVDPFNAPIYSDNPVTIENVLVAPVTTEDIISNLQLYGKRAVYELCIPKEDSHNWEDKTVEFFGQKWRTFGFPQKWIDENVPLSWNLKVKVERYG